MNNKNLSVAMIEPVGGHGGMNFYNFGLCDGLIKAGCHVSLNTCDKTSQPDVSGLIFRPIYKGIYGKSPSWLRAYRYLISSINLIFQIVFSGEKICHYHFFHGGITEILNLLLAKLFIRKVVITVHDVESFDISLLSTTTVGFFYRLADKIIVHNKVCRDEVIEKLHISPDKIRVIPMGNYLQMTGDVYEKSKAKRLLGIDDSKKVILFFGHIKEVKCLELLLKAMPAVLEKEPNTLLLIAGRPWKSDFSKYEAIIDQLRICDNCVTHIRYIPDEEVPIYYGACDVVALPYRRIYQSAVVLVAMSYGKAVLVSDLPSMVELVSDGENGFVFHQGDCESLSAKLITLLSDGLLREQVARNGLEFVRTNHDWQRIGEMTSAVYRELI